MYLWVVFVSVYVFWWVGIYFLKWDKKMATVKRESGD